MPVVAASPAPYLNTADDEGAAEEGDDLGELQDTMRNGRSKKIVERRSSMVDEDVQFAWMTRGWTLRASIARHTDSGLKDEGIEEGAADAHPKGEEQLRLGQNKLTALMDVNQHVKSVLVKKKIKVQELRVKIDALVKALSAARDAEQEARQQDLDDTEENILLEEKQKQEMMLDLSQRIRQCEDQVASTTAANAALEATNAKNKKLLREQQNETKERKKAIQHLERHMHVFEGSQRNSSAQGGGIIPEHSMPNVLPLEGGSSFQDDLDSEASGALDRRTGRQVTCSKSLLRGAQAEKHLQEQKRRLEEQKLLSTQTMMSPGRTASDLKSLPGLNLASLLGNDEDASGGKPPLLEEDPSTPTLRMPRPTAF